MKLSGASLAEIHKTTELYSSPAHYSRFFENRIYIGVLEYGGREYQNFVPALITQEEFDAVQEIMAESVKKLAGKHAGLAESRRKSSPYALSGLVFCGHHGEPHPMMQANVDGKRWQHYQCPKRKECKTPRISADAIHNVVIEELRKTVLNPRKLCSAATEMAAEMSEQRAVDEKSLADVEMKLIVARDALNALLDVIERGNFSDALAERLADREAEVKLLAARRTALRSAVSNDPVRVTNEQIVQWSELICNTLDDGDKQKIRTLVRHFVNRVVVCGETLYIEFSFPPEDDTHGKENMTPTGHTLKTRLLPKIVFVPQLDKPGRLVPVHACRDACAMRSAGMTYSAIAKALGVSIETARQYVMRDRTVGQ